MESPNLNNDYLVNIPEDYLCPITQELMEDPVIAADGHSNERAAITPYGYKKVVILVP